MFNAIERFEARLLKKFGQGRKAGILTPAVKQVPVSEWAVRLFFWEAACIEQWWLDGAVSCERALDLCDQWLNTKNRMDELDSEDGACRLLQSHEVMQQVMRLRSTIDHFTTPVVGSDDGIILRREFLKQRDNFYKERNKLNYVRGRQPRPRRYLLDWCPQRPAGLIAEHGS